MAGKVGVIGAQRGQFGERGNGRPCVIPPSLQIEDAVVVRLALLLLGELGLDELFDQSANAGTGDLAGLVLLGGDGLAHRAAGIGQYDFFPDMLGHHMAHLVADDENQFAVVKHIHQSAVDPDGAVGHGKGVDRWCEVDLEVELDTVVAASAADQPRETLRVGIVRRRHGVVPVRSEGDRQSQSMDLLVGQGGRLNGVPARFDDHTDVGVLAAGGRKPQDGKKDNQRRCQGICSH